MKRKQDIRKIVQSAMDRLKVTQMELSKASGISQPTLSAWLMKENESIGSRRLESIFKVLKLKVRKDKKSAKVSRAIQT